MYLDIAHLVDLVHVIQGDDGRCRRLKPGGNRLALRLGRPIVYQDFSFQCFGHHSVFYLPRGPPPPPPNGLGWNGFCEAFLLLLPGISFCPITTVSPSLISRPAISVTRPLVILTRTNRLSRFLSGPGT